MKTSLTTLDLNTFVHAQGHMQVDTGWTSGSFVSLIQEENKPSAFVGHFLTPEVEALAEFLAQARSAFGDRVRVLLRGAAVLQKKTDPARVRRALLGRKEREREGILEAFHAAGFRKEGMDVEWAKKNRSVKIIYDARTASHRILEEPCDTDDADPFPLPDVL